MRKPEVLGFSEVGLISSCELPTRILILCKSTMCSSLQNHLHFLLKITFCMSWVVHVWACMCVCVDRHHVGSLVTPYVTFRDPSLTRGSLAGYQSPGASLFSRISAMCWHLWLFKWVLGIKLRSSWLQGGCFICCISFPSSSSQFV